MAEARLGLGKQRAAANPVLSVAVVTGLAAEARIARRLGFRAEAAGGGEKATRAAIARLIAEGASALLSFGICGGLDSRLASGTLILPRAVADEAGARWPVDDAMHRSLALALKKAGFDAATGDILGARAPAESTQQKSALFHEFRTVAIDLESQHVAHAAATARLPLIVLRAVADAAGRALPPAARVGLGREGSIVLGPVLLSLAGHPQQLPALIRLAVETRRALGALRRAGPVVAALFGGRREADGGG